MKTYFFIISVIVIFLASCSHENNGNRLLLLKIDYLTHDFEGGKEMEFDNTGYENDSLPITVNYQSPGDFGSIELIYNPSGEQIFKGTIVWMGCGDIIFPKSFVDPDDFDQIQNTVAPPDTNFIQEIFNENVSDSIFANIWNSVSNLTLVQQYMQAGNKVGIFLYTPSVGIGDPADWDYFLIFRK